MEIKEVKQMDELVTIQIDESQLTRLIDENIESIRRIPNSNPGIIPYALNMKKQDAFNFTSTFLREIQGTEEKKKKTTKRTKKKKKKTRKKKTRKIATPCAPRKKTKVISSIYGDEEVDRRMSQFDAWLKTGKKTEPVEFFE